MMNLIEDILIIGIILGAAVASSNNDISVVDAAIAKLEPEYEENTIGYTILIFVGMVLKAGYIIGLTIGKSAIYIAFLSMTLSRLWVPLLHIMAVVYLSLKKLMKNWRW